MNLIIATFQSSLPQAHTGMLLGHAQCGKYETLTTQMSVKHV